MQAAAIVENSTAALFSKEIKMDLPHNLAVPLWESN
jgi:hypothetical protein